MAWLTFARRRASVLGVLGLLTLIALAFVVAGVASTISPGHGDQRSAGAFATIVGVGFLLFLASRLRRVWLARPPETGLEIRSYLINRPSAIRVADNCLHIDLPLYFSEPWKVAITEVGWVEQPLPPEAAASPVEPITYRVTNLPSTGPTVPPNLGLTFAARLETPPLKRLQRFAYQGFPGPLRRGAFRLSLDGLLVRMVDARRAGELLAAAGVEGVVDPIAWLDGRRER